MSLLYTGTRKGDTSGIVCSSTQEIKERNKMIMETCFQTQTKVTGAAAKAENRKKLVFDLQSVLCAQVFGGGLSQLTKQTWLGSFVHSGAIECSHEHVIVIIRV